MKVTIAIIITFSVLSGTQMLWGQSGMQNIEALKTGAFAQRAEAMKSLCQARQAIISALLTIMDGETSADIKRDVAKVLGDYRAVEAVEPLVRNLELELQLRILKGLIKDEDLCPISQALKKIGKPAIPALLAKITASDNAVLIQRCAKICVDIEGQEVAELIMNRHLEKVPKSEEKNRLKQALDAIHTAE